MKELINISGQQFYYSTLEELKGRWSQKEKCAIIIDEIYLNEFLSNGGNIIGESGQIIIISESVNAALSKLEGINVLLIAAGSFEEAVRIAILGSALIKKVICILKDDEDKVGEIIDVIIT